MAALVYVYDHETRQLSKRLMNDHHSHSDLSIAAVHVHVDAESCLEVSLLRGPKAEVEHFAQHVIGERGVRYGRLVVVPASAEGPARGHQLPRKLNQVGWNGLRGLDHLHRGR